MVDFSKRFCLHLALFVFGLLGGTPVFALPQTQRYYLAFEQRLALSYLLQAAGSSAEDRNTTADRFVRFLEGQSQKKVLIEVKTFDEFIDRWRGEWPNTHRLDLDLQLLERKQQSGQRVFFSKDPAEAGKSLFPSENREPSSHYPG